jgi:predicted metalloendopeptidase
MTSPRLDTALLYSRLYLCCGHELTHGFDTNGVNFDENGNSNPSWWSAADHLAYTTRVQSVISFYQGREVCRANTRMARRWFPKPAPIARGCAS